MPRDGRAADASNATMTKDEGKRVRPTFLNVDDNVDLDTEKHNYGDPLWQGVVKPFDAFRVTCNSPISRSTVLAAFQRTALRELTVVGMSGGMVEEYVDVLIDG